MQFITNRLRAKLRNWLGIEDEKKQLQSALAQRHENLEKRFSHLLHVMETDRFWITDYMKMHAEMHTALEVHITQQTEIGEQKYDTLLHLMNQGFTKLADRSDEIEKILTDAHQNLMNILGADLTNIAAKIGTHEDQVLIIAQQLNTNTKLLMLLRTLFPQFRKAAVKIFQEVARKETKQNGTHPEPHDGILEEAEELQPEVLERGLKLMEDDAAPPVVDDTQLNLNPNDNGD